MLERAGGLRTFGSRLRRRQPFDHPGHSHRQRKRARLLFHCVTTHAACIPVCLHGHACTSIHMRQLWLLLLQARRSTTHHLMRAARRTSPPWRQLPVGWGRASLGPRHDRPDLVCACGPCTAGGLPVVRRSQAGALRTQVGYAGADHRHGKPRASRQMIRSPACIQVSARVCSRTSRMPYRSAHA